MASDLRFVVSVLRVLAELERIGDLALRVVKLAPDHRRCSPASRRTFDILVAMADQAVERYRDALRAWAAMDLGAGHRAGHRRSATMDLYYERLMGELLRLDGPDAVRIAVTTCYAGRALERIGDHAAIIGRPAALPAHRRPEPPRAEVR